MTGRRATLDDSTVCSIERALLDKSFVYLLIFIEGNAVSVINLIRHRALYLVCRPQCKHKLQNMYKKFYMKNCKKTVLKKSLLYLLTVFVTLESTFSSKLQTMAYYTNISTNLTFICS